MPYGLMLLIGSDASEHARGFGLCAFACPVFEIIDKSSYHCRL